MSVELLNALKMVADERRMSVDDLITTIEEAVAAAACKRLERDNLEARFLRGAGEFELDELLTVVEKMRDHEYEITLVDAQEIDPEVAMGGIVRRVFRMEGLGRIAAQSVRQTIHKKAKEVEIANLSDKYEKRIGEMVSVTMTRKIGKSPIFDLGEVEGILKPDRQLVHERIDRGRRVKMTIAGVNDIRREPLVLLSRVAPELVQRLVEMETPEITDGIVEVINVSRDSSGASKVAVTSRRKDVDPVGAVIGVRGSRIQPISKELGGEKIDIILYSDDPKKYISAALTPAKRTEVILDPKEKFADVIVADEELSKAIGKRGVNVRLASVLTGWQLDVMSRAEYDEKQARLGLWKGKKDRSVPTDAPAKVEDRVRRNQTEPGSDEGSGA
jgi:N utilization substance protein A